MTRSRVALGAMLTLVTMALVRAHQERPVFHGAADAVVVDVSVTLRSKPVSGLTASDFVLTDNGVPQTILDVGRESTSVDVTVALDLGDNVGGNSRYTKSLIEAVGRIGATMRADDRLALVAFSDRVAQVRPLGPPAALTADVLSSLSNGRYRSRHSAVYDALTTVSASQVVPGRRAMTILCVSGPDGASLSGPDEALEVARLAGIPTFVIGSTWSAAMAAPHEGTPMFGRRSVAIPLFLPDKPPVAFLQRVADDTGGLLQVIDPNTPVSRSFVRALDEFRASYALRFIPTGVTRGGWHELVVRVTKTDWSYQVRARKGYGVAAESGRREGIN